MGEKAAPKHPDHEHHRGDEDDRPAADQVGQLSGTERTHHRPHQQQAGDQLLVEGADVPEAGVQKQQGARHDAGVVAEEQAPQCGDGGRPHHRPADRLLAGVRPGGFSRWDDRSSNRLHTHARLLSGLSWAKDRPPRWRRPSLLISAGLPRHRRRDPPPPGLARSCRVAGADDGRRGIGWAQVATGRPGAKGQPGDHQRAVSRCHLPHGLPPSAARVSRAVSSAFPGANARRGVFRWGGHRKGRVDRGTRAGASCSQVEPTTTGRIGH